MTRRQTRSTERAPAPISRSREQPLRVRGVLTILSLLAPLVVASRSTATPAAACAPPTLSAIAGAFDLAAAGLNTDPAARIPDTTGVAAIPPSVLKAVGWVESNWRQFTPAGRPLVSFDFGYGIMQITSGMAGAFGDPEGNLPPDVQAKVASDYRFNIAFGARMLAQKWAGVPRIGDGDPASIENWYYALWAYNGWGWANNPKNPRFTRQGTPATFPATYPYQERVLYLVSHPPRDAAGNPLWQPVPVWMPKPSVIGSNPGTYKPAQVHRQPPPAFAAQFSAPSLHTVGPSGTQRVAVKVTNTGAQPWAATGTSAVSLTYHLFTAGSNPWVPLSPFTEGVVALGQAPTPLPHNLLPGRSATIHVPVQAPPSNGKYLVVWDLEEAPAILLSASGVLVHAQPLLVATGNRATPTPTPVVAPTRAVAEGMLFTSDTSIPDGTSLAPKTVFQKGWLVFNNGLTAWGRGWTLHRVSGPKLGAKAIPVPAVAACTSTNLLITMKSPTKPGSYRAKWRLRDPTGANVGDPLTVVITVRGKPSASPTPLPTYTPTSIPKHPTATPTSTPTG